MSACPSYAPAPRLSLVPPPVARRTDKQLFALATAGSSAAFAAIVTRHRAKVVAFCARRLNPSDVEDVVQDVFLKLHELVTAGKIRSDAGSAPVGYLYLTARSACGRAKKAARCEKRGGGRSTREIDDPTLGAALADRMTPGADGALATKQIYEALCDGIATLTVTQRRAIVARYGDGAVLGGSKGRAEWHLRQAYEQLRRAMAARGFRAA